MKEKKKIFICFKVQNSGTGCSQQGCPQFYLKPDVPRSTNLRVKQIKYLISPGNFSQLQTLYINDQRIHIKSGHKLHHKTGHIFRNFLLPSLQYDDFPFYLNQGHDRYFKIYVPHLDTLLRVHISFYPHYQRV